MLRSLNYFSMDSLVLFALIVFIIPFLLLITLFKPSSKNLPPGPPAWPLIGTLLPKLKKQPHVELTKLAKSHGPLMLLKFGVEPVVVASNHVAAMEVLKTHDRELSGRFAPHSVRIKGYVEHSMVWADCTDYWKLVRKIWRTEMFSTTMLDAQACVREEKVLELVGFLKGKQGEVVKFADVVFGCILNILGAIVFSQNVYDFEDESDNELGMKGMIRQLMILAATPNLADLYPILGKSDFQGLKKASAACVTRMNESWATVVKERRNSDHLKNDFLNVLIKAGFSDPQIDAMLLEIFGPGSDTSTSTIEWAMAELLKSPEKLKNVQNELKKVIGANQVVKESDLPNLPYLNACVKETLRLHPPVTFLLPHRALEECQVMGYTIPKGSQLMVNTYAIGRDPETWNNPLSFEPERFLSDTQIDYQSSTDMKYIPFGAGRRICPGLSLAARLVPLVLASLIHAFDWSLPGGMDPSEIDMKDKFGLALLKDDPLLIIPKVTKV